jgi:hypothetical protein
MYTAATVEGVIAWQCLAYFFKSFVLATCIALPTKMLQAQLVGSGVGMVNLGAAGGLHLAAGDRLPGQRLCQL